MFAVIFLKENYTYSTRLTRKQANHIRDTMNSLIIYSLRLTKRNETVLIPVQQYGVALEINSKIVHETEKQSYSTRDVRIRSAREAEENMPSADTEKLMKKLLRKFP